MTFSERHLQEAREIIDAIDVAPIERMVSILVQVRDAGGRLFFLGVGGSAGNCGHAVNDMVRGIRHARINYVNNSTSCNRWAICSAAKLSR